jgi:hypothetical protein
MTKKHFWKLSLRPNLLTKDVANDYVAEVSTVGTTLRNEDIARRIVAERSEIRYETLLSALQERDAIVREAVLGGSSVQDGNIHLTPRVSGNWEGVTPHFDPEHHRITISLSLTAEFRKALNEEVGVEIIGVKTDGGAAIGTVTDITSGKIDTVLTPDGDVIIEGEKIRIAPIGADGTGVFFVSTDGTETPVTHPFTQNNPKKIVCRVPMLAEGFYTVKIITRFSTGAHLLNNPRTILYDRPLKVE